MRLKSVAPIRNGITLFKPINLTLGSGKIVTLMGASGIGKTSLLECIAGNCHHVGQIQNKNSIFRVFQDTNQLFPWMTIRKNLQLVADIDWDLIAKQIGLNQHLDKMPEECSVGQRQRFTLIRALYSDRSILLCDEPISGVDYSTGEEIIKEFKRHVKKSNKKVLCITHNPKEAKQLGKVIKIQ